jgi:hypothetical protein
LIEIKVPTSVGDDENHGTDNTHWATAHQLARDSQCKIIVLAGEGHRIWQPTRRRRTIRNLSNRRGAAINTRGPTTGTRRDFLKLAGKAQSPASGRLRLHDDGNDKLARAAPSTFIIIYFKELIDEIKKL